jgi:type IV secretory pathway VirB10-like protein
VKQYLALLWVVGLIAACPAIAAAQSTSTPTHAQRTSNGSVVLPAGTEIAIQTNEAIDSKTARVGQTFPAQVAQDVMSPSGQVLIPKGLKQP